MHARLDKHAATEKDVQLETQIVKEEEQFTVPTIGKVEPLEDDDGGGGQRNPPEEHDANDEDNGDDSDDDEDYVMSGARYGTSSSILTTAASLFEESHGALSFVPVGSNHHHHQMHPPMPQDTVSDDIALMVGRPDELGYFQCPIGTCDRKYKIKYSLLRHLRNECLADRRYACPKCDKKFCYSFILNRHLLKVHKESPGYY